MPIWAASASTTTHPWASAPAVAVGAGVLVAGSLAGDAVGVWETAGNGLGVAVGVAVGRGDAVGRAVGVGDGRRGIAVGVALGVTVGVGLGVTVGVGLGMGVALGDAVTLGVLVTVAVGTLVAVRVGVMVAGDGDAAGAGSTAPSVLAARTGAVAVETDSAGVPGDRVTSRAKTVGVTSRAGVADGPVGGSGI